MQKKKKKKIIVLGTSIIDYTIMLPMLPIIFYY